MNEEEKEDFELDIEAKYVDRTEKEFLSNITYAECLYILTPKNKYCDKIRELSVLKLCKIIDKLQKENEELKNQEATQRKINELLVQRYSNSISVQKVKDKIEHYQKLQDNYIEKYDEINESLQAMINALQELLEGRE